MKFNPFSHPFAPAVAAIMLSIPGTHRAIADYVIPQIGGGQVGMMGASMKHADITFDGTNLAIHLDDTVPTPELRPLTGGDEFDPTQPWSVLTGSAYNFQYAWNPGGFITLPSGAGIWVERVSQDAELHVYLRTPQYNAGTDGSTWPEIFTYDGDRWQWAGAMQHNAYTVFNPTQSSYSATYLVYIGDATTGDPLDGYGSATVTWVWNATPVPEPASLAMLAAIVPMLARRRKA